VASLILLYCLFFCHILVKHLAVVTYYMYYYYYYYYLIVSNFFFLLIRPRRMFLYYYYNYICCNNHTIVFIELSDPLSTVKDPAFNSDVYGQMSAWMPCRLKHVQYPSCKSLSLITFPTSSSFAAECLQFMKSFYLFQKHIRVNT
jgi:hypothetical protein